MTPPSPRPYARRLLWPCVCLLGALGVLATLAPPGHAQITPDQENQRRARQAEIDKRKADEQRQEAQRKQLQAERDRAEAKLRQEQAERERAEAQARAKRLEDDLAKLKAAQAAAPASQPPSTAAAAPSLTTASLPNVDGLPRDRLLALQREAATGAGLSGGQVEFNDRLSHGQMGPRLVVLPAGRFQMGSNRYPDEGPPHVRHIESFALMKTEVTVGQYLACVDAGGCQTPVWREARQANPPRSHQIGSAEEYPIQPDKKRDLYLEMGAALTDENSPVVGVSWDNARQYAEWLSEQTKRKYRLPSEAEWEYAARAGSTGQWSFGDDESQLGNYARFDENSQKTIWAVGGRQPNAWGLHDMHGNVAEWVQDCSHASYRGAPEAGVAWETGCTNSSRVARGGSWNLWSFFLRSASKQSMWSNFSNPWTGFRLARAI